MPFLLPVNTINELRIELNLLASMKGGNRVECRRESKSNYDTLKAVDQTNGKCKWEQFIIACDVDRADPDPDAVVTPNNAHARGATFPHLAGHNALLVDARDESTSRVFILDDTALQWDHPALASHMAASNRRELWTEYLTFHHGKVRQPVSPPLNLSAGLKTSAQHILAEGSDKNLAVSDWQQKIRTHPFALRILNIEVFDTVKSDHVTE